MKRYAYVRDGIVQSVFETDKSPAEMPDIASNLHEVGKDVRCNDIFCEGKFFKRPDPVEVAQDGEGNPIFADPKVIIQPGGVPWSAIISGGAVSLIAALIQYFFG